MLGTHNVKIWRLIKADVLRPAREPRQSRGGKGTATLYFDEHERRAASAVMAFTRAYTNTGHHIDYGLLRAIADAARQPSHHRWLVVFHSGHVTGTADDETAAMMTEARMLIDLNSLSCASG